MTNYLDWAIEAPPPAVRDEQEKSCSSWEREVYKPFEDWVGAQLAAVGIVWVVFGILVMAGVIVP